MLSNINFLDLFKLDSKKAFICGGLGLIGRNISKALHDAGAEVVILDIDEESASMFITDNFSKNISFQYFDCSDLDNIEKNINELLENCGCPNIFINCSWPRTDDFARNNFNDLKLNSLRRNIDIHLNSYAWLAIAAAECMSNNSIKGSIIQYGSSYGLVGQDLSVYKGTDMKENASYSASKGGIINLTRSMASYYGQYGIRVNTICPGGVKGHVAGKSSGQDETFLDNYSDKVPLGRLADSFELAAPTLFLSSEASSYVTGATLVVDGGWTAI